MKNSSITLSVDNNSGQSLTLSMSVSEQMAGSRMIENVQIIGTAWEAIMIGDCSRADILACVNADPTNFIQLASDNAGAKLIAKLTPGRGALIPVDPTVTIYAKADTGACDLRVLVVEP